MHISRKVRDVHRHHWLAAWLLLLALAACSQVATPLESGLRGTVVDASQAPVAGAAVQFYSADADGTRPPQYETTTDAEGVYLYPNAPVGTYNILVAQGSQVAFIESVEVRGNALTEVPPALPAASGTVRGTITLEGSSDHEGAAVFVPGTSLVAYTDAGGAFTLSVPPGSYRLVAQAAGYEPAAQNEVAVTAGGSATVDLRLTPVSIPAAPAPRITALEPDPVAPGELLTIRGANFGDVQAASGVRVGAFVVTEYRHWTPDELRVRVPAMLPEGETQVTVVVAGQEVSAGLSIQDHNQPPEAAFTFAPESGFAPLVVQFDAAGSSDPDGEIVAYRWDFGGGASGEGASVEHTYEEDGTYTITLTVWDERGATDSTQQELEVGGFEQTATLHNARPGERLGFGPALAIDGDTILAGFPYTDSKWYQDPEGHSQLAARGHVNIYERQPDGSWVSAGSITPPHPDVEYMFGHAVALSGDYAAITGIHEVGQVSDPIDSSLGVVHVYHRNAGGPWRLRQEIVTDQIWSTFLAGTTLVVWAHEGTAAGSEDVILIHDRDEGGKDNWGLAKRITAADYVEYGAAAFFGHGIGLSDDGNTLIVGHSGSNDGYIQDPAAYIFERNHGGPSAWGLVKKLTPPPLTGDRAHLINHTYGWAVDIEGDTAVVGSVPILGGNESEVFIYERDLGGSNNWGERARHVIHSVPPESPFSGRLWSSKTSVVIESDTVIAAATPTGCSPEVLYEDCNIQGQAYVFARNQGGPERWGLAQMVQPDEAIPRQNFGISLDATVGTLVIGGQAETGDGGRTEAVFIFER